MTPARMTPARMTPARTRSSTMNSATMRPSRTRRSSRTTSIPCPRAMPTLTMSRRWRMAMSELVRADDIERAAAALEGVAVHTPLLPAAWLSELLGAEVRLKCENLQRAGAFKIRGAYTAIARLTAAERSRGVIAYSSGNHAQGVALAAQLFGIKAVVVMPTTAPEVKRAGAEALGAEIVLEGTTSHDRQVRAEAIAAERGLTIIPAFDDLNIITGQGTVGAEILQDWPE